VVLRLAVELSPSDQAGEVRALAMFVDVNAGKGTEQSFPVVCLTSSDAVTVEAEEPHAEVTKEVGLLLAAKAKDEAARLGREGDFVAAVSALRTTRAMLGSSRLFAAAMSKSDIDGLEAIEQHLANAPTPSTLKEMHYQSYLGRERRKRYDPPSEKK
jgi:hypothetical protein